MKKRHVQAYNYPKPVAAGVHHKPYKRFSNLDGLNDLKGPGSPKMSVRHTSLPHGGAPKK